MPTPEARARQNIDRQLTACGWVVQDRRGADITAAPGVAVREFPLLDGDEADYMLYADGKAIGVVEAKPEGFTLTGVEVQTDRYAVELPPALPAHRRPLPFIYQSTGVETKFTNLLDPDARSREVFTFHRPRTLLEWVNRDAQLRGRLSGGRLRRDGQLWKVQAAAMEKQDDVIVRNDFWASPKNKQLNFVQHVKTLLEINGWAAIVVPDNVLFEGGAGERIRRKLLHECDVHTLLRLPAGVFYAQGVNANVLFFTASPPARSRGRRHCGCTICGRTCTSRSRPIR